MKIRKLLSAAAIPIFAGYFLQHGASEKNVQETMEEDDDDGVINKEQAYMSVDQGIAAPVSTSGMTTIDAGKAQEKGDEVFRFPEAFSHQNRGKTTVTAIDEEMTETDGVPKDVNVEGQGALQEEEEPEADATKPIDRYSSIKQDSTGLQLLLEHRHQMRMKELEVHAKDSPRDIIYQQSAKAATVIHYLGVGYDLVRGNPLGDSILMADPGFRSPIIKFSYANSADLETDPSAGSPIGTYARPFIACKQSEEISEIDSLRNYQKELSIDASLAAMIPSSILSFSASLGYKRFVQEQAKRAFKTFMIRTYCIRYEAGLARSENFDWEKTAGFEAAVKSLPDQFRMNEQDRHCTVAAWKNEPNQLPCKNSNVVKWMEFFQEFGTHYTVHLYSGGKVVYQASLSVSDIARLRSRGIDVKQAVQQMILPITEPEPANRAAYSKYMDARKQEMSIKKEVIVIGGKTPGDLTNPASLADWAETVEHAPMPVKIQVSPMQNVLPMSKKEAYTEAYAFYARALGMSPADLEALTGGIHRFPDVLREMTQVTYAGPPPGYAMCPSDTVVIMGFSIFLNLNTDGETLEDYHINSCTPGREKCDGSGFQGSKNDDVRIWVLCGKEFLGDVHQIVEESPPEDLFLKEKKPLFGKFKDEKKDAFTKAECPENMVIGLGLGISVANRKDGAQDTTISHCRPGQKSCTKDLSTGTAKNFVWIACVDDQYPAIDQVTLLSSTTKVGDAKQGGDITMECPKDEKIVAGFLLDAHTRLPKARQTFRVCQKNSMSCSMNAPPLDKSKPFSIRNDKRALVGFIVCAESDQPSSAEEKSSRNTKRNISSAKMFNYQESNQPAILETIDSKLSGFINKKKQRNN